VRLGATGVGQRRVGATARKAAARESDGSVPDEHDLGCAGGQLEGRLKGSGYEGVFVRPTAD